MYSDGLNGDYDCVIKDSLGSTIRTLENINPDSTGNETITNLILNGNFEDVSNNLPINWTLFEWNIGANVATEQDHANGAWSMKFTSVGLGGGHVTSSFFEVDVNMYLTVSFGIKSSTALVRNIVQVLWYDDDKVLLSSTTLYDNSTTNPTDWTEYVSTVRPPGTPVLIAKSKFAQIRLIGADSSVGTTGQTWYDGIQVRLTPRRIASTGLTVALHNGIFLR